MSRIINGLNRHIKFFFAQKVFAPILRCFQILQRCHERKDPSQAVLSPSSMDDESAKRGHEPETNKRSGASQNKKANGLCIVSFFLEVLASFRPLFSRYASFIWFAVTIIGFVFRQDHLGVSSIIRWLEIPGSQYETFLHFFHSSSWSLTHLLHHWWGWLMQHSPLLSVNSRIVLLGDHTKEPKDGRKMPGVVTLHQESESSSKPGFFRGHHWGFIGLLMGSSENSFCAPLWGQLHQGHSDVSDEREDNIESKITNKLIRMALGVCKSMQRLSYLVLDAYFAVNTTFFALESFLSQDGKPLIHVITRAKRNVVAYEAVPESTKKKKGRRSKYGKPLKLYKLFDQMPEKFLKARCRVYGRSETVSYLPLALLWRPIRAKLQFVLAETSLGRIVLMSSDLDLDPLNMIELYSLRSRIETMFSVLKNVLGGLFYRFWSKALSPQSRRPLKNSRQRQKPESNQVSNVLATWAAIEGFVNFAAIVLGLLQVISLHFSKILWGQNSLWLRTYSKLVASEYIVKHVLTKIWMMNFSIIRSHAIITKILALCRRPRYDKDVHAP
jgi:hypothetical protein